MNIEESLKRKKVQFLIKRVFDFFASAAGLIFLSPAFLVIALLIKKSSPGPVFFRQVRVGKDQKPFEIYKFRTMAMRREEGKKITVGKDRRITSIGSVLRKYKLDEFPQLINVFKGEMSLVGRVLWVEEAQVVGRRMSRPAATSASVREAPKMG